MLLAALWDLLHYRQDENPSSIYIPLFNKILYITKYSFLIQGKSVHIVLPCNINVVLEIASKAGKNCLAGLASWSHQQVWHIKWVSDPTWPFYEWIGIECSDYCSSHQVSVFKYVFEICKLLLKSRTKNKHFSEWFKCKCLNMDFAIVVYVASMCLLFFKNVKRILIYYGVLKFLSNHKNVNCIYSGIKVFLSVLKTKIWNAHFYHISDWTVDRKKCFFHVWVVFITLE